VNDLRLLLILGVYAAGVLVAAMVIGMAVRVFKAFAGL